MTDVVVPSVEFGDETLVLSRWLAADGARVKRGQALLVCEASKVAVEVPSPADGFLQTQAREGSSLPVGAVAGRIVPAETDLDGENLRERVTRRAAALAAAHGIDLARLAGAGIVTERTVLAAMAGTPLARASEPAPATRAVRLDPVQAAVGRKARRALEVNAHAFVLARYEVEASLCYLEETLAAGRLIPFGDLVVFHVARCLRELPRFNAYVHDDSVHEYESVNVGFAVEAAGRLYTPVVHGADELDLETLSLRMQERKLEVLRGRPGPACLLGGTFTVSTLDAEGLVHHLPIINGAQGAVLGVGACERAFVPRDDGSPRVSRFAGFCLSYDHRLVNGSDAARFLSLLGRKLACPADVRARAREGK